MQHDGHHHRNAEQPDQDQAGAPTDRHRQQRHQRRRSRETQIAAERVQRKRAAHAVLVHRARQDRIVRRMEHRIAHARKRRQQQDLPEAGGKSHRSDAQRHHQRATDQEPTRAIAIHQKTHRRLQQRGRPGHQRDREAEFGEAHLECRLPGQEQRRQAQCVKVREEVAVAEQQIDTCGAAQGHRMVSPGGASKMLRRRALRQPACPMVPICQLVVFVTSPSAIGVTLSHRSITPVARSIA